MQIPILRQTLQQWLQTDRNSEAQASTCRLSRIQVPCRVPLQSRYHRRKGQRAVQESSIQRAKTNTELKELMERVDSPMKVFEKTSEKFQQYYDDACVTLAKRALLYIKVWVIGDYFMISHLQNIVMRRLLDEFSPRNDVPHRIRLPPLSPPWLRGTKRRCWIWQQRQFASLLGHRALSLEI